MRCNFSTGDHTGWYSAFVDAIAPMFRGGSVLLIGTGSTHEQYVDWPENLLEMGAASVSYLEAWQPYVAKWSTGPYPVIFGMAGRATEAVGSGSYDCVIFNQGIEHVGLENVRAVADELLAVSRRGVAMSAPYGGFYDYQEDWGGNPWERHVIKSPAPEMFSMLADWSIRTFGNKGAGDAVIWMWKTKMPSGEPSTLGLGASVSTESGDDPGGVQRRPGE